MRKPGLRGREHTEVLAPSPRRLAVRCGSAGAHALVVVGRPGPRRVRVARLVTVGGVLALAPNAVRWPVCVCVFAFSGELPEPSLTARHLSHRCHSGRRGSTSVFGGH